MKLDKEMGLVRDQSPLNGRIDFVLAIARLLFAAPRKEGSNRALYNIGVIGRATALRRTRDQASCFGVHKLNGANCIEIFQRGIHVTAGEHPGGRSYN